MTINQLQYIIAVEKYRSFSQAAEECCVSQPALSMQIKQLENWLGIQIFDRTRTPIDVTPAGEKVLRQAKVTLVEYRKIKDLADATKIEASGELRVGIIPTLAPYLLPLFLKKYTELFPKVQLKLKELPTHQIVEYISNYELDMGIMATPITAQHLIEKPLFYEELYAYVSPQTAAHRSTYILPDTIKPDELWLLEEGHCLRSQIMNLCELKLSSRSANAIEFEAGSIETLMRLVDSYHGITIVPQLATLQFSEEEMSKIRFFAEPVPKREISLLYHQNFQRTSVVDGLHRCIVDNLPNDFRKRQHTTYQVLGVH